MILRRFLVFWTISFLCITVSSGATITVTSNADNGPGSLRDALTQAAANGFMVQDKIVFNISDISEAGRTINLLTELPAISTNVIIDGTTQPGVVFGISNAKIKLNLDVYPSTGYFTCLLVENASQIEIYGLYLAFNQDPRSGGELYGIRIKNSHDVIIGAKGKGNVINGWFWNITNRYYNYFLDNSNTVSIKGNMIGVSEFGLKTFLILSPLDILMSDTYNLEVGGTDPAEGNQMVSMYDCLETNYSDPDIPGTFFVKFINNKIQTDPTGTFAIDGSYDGAVILNGTNIPTTDTETVKTLVVDNVISGSNSHIQLELTGITHLVKVMGNKIGTDITGTNQIGSSDVGLLVSSCYKVLVGSDDPADINYFSGNGMGIFNGSTPKLLITKNSFFCNGQGIAISGWSGINPQPYITINAYTASVISGTSNPGARIELFQNHQCSTYYGTCQGKTYITSLFADITGKWTYTGPQTSAMIATATTVDSATSEFPIPEIKRGAVQVIQATCGKSNGSISGYNIISGTEFKWIDQYGNTVSTDTNATNLQPGNYYLVASFGPTGCSVNTDGIQIINQQPPATINAQILDPVCGQKNGEIFFTGDLHGCNSFLVNVLNDTMSFTEYDPYIWPGTYRLVAFPSGDESCLVTYGPYIVTNQSGPSVNIQSAVIQPASCHSPNGSISSIQFTNTTGSPYYRWVDASGNTVGNSADLMNISAGQYRLKFKDGGGCDTITTDLITVTDLGSIQMDSSGRSTTASSCSANTGRIEHFMIQNGSTYQWIDPLTRTVEGGSVDLINVPSGYYRLIVSNASGCSDSTGIYFIPQETARPVTATFNMHPETCNRKDGSLEMATLSDNPQNYQFEWRSVSDGLLMGTSQKISGLDTGYYFLYATDSKGCRQLVSKENVSSAPAPQISSVSVDPDICSEKKGTVNLNTIQGSAPFSISWYDSNGQIPGNSASLQNQSKGDYYAVITDANNCVTTSPHYSIEDSILIIEAPAYASLYVLSGDQATLSPTYPDNGLYSLYRYENEKIPDQQNASGVFITGPLTVDTTIFISFARGSCSSPLTEVPVKIITALTVKMPNAFTPGNNGHNNLFRVKYPEVIKSFHMSIFDRWGQKIFECTDPYKGWDGTFNGIPQPMGTFVWMISYTDVFGKNKQISGTVILIR